MRKYFAIAASLVLFVTVFGCTTIYKAAVDERNVKTIAADKKITAIITKRFFDDKVIKVLGISPYCYEGHVYLVGEYETAGEKTRAIKIAKKVEGIKSVTTYILRKKKNDNSCGTKKNLEITARVKAKLIKDKGIWSTNVNVKTIQCKVVLVGVVGSKGEINKAVNHAKSVKGVRSVKSYLKSVK